ncbi:unnamed protein product [Lepeophtheirus salmonis]|uniref:(salmon louse) hypothetical protein n=1 Tax=Lepeophtheirus salmonis TaxID=72036 RepID=A0A7R8CMX1_LEPSM|nr:unnamed protein product [Lepeophtheirus salmonis]CAF2869566.1 unnamed protein product [Lepeophtheirus salmonis]
MLVIICIYLVVLPPELADQSNDNDEEGDDNILDNNYMLDEIAGEVEIHGEDSEEDNNAEHGHDDVTNTISKRWRKNEKNFFGELDPLLKSDVVSKYAEERQTNLYAQRDKNTPTFSVDASEMRKFLGLLIISGYHCLPSEKDYSRTADDMEAPIFAKVMSKDRFRIIKKYLHISDNENLAHSKVAKMFPLFDMLRNNCQQFGVFHEQLSIDGSMVPYRDGTVVCVKWNDNCPVTVAGNYYGVFPIQKVERSVKHEHKKTVDQPYLIKMYNQGTGDVDICDRLLASSRPRLRSKKWWWNLFYKHVNKTNTTPLQFRREIARALVKSENIRKRQGGPTAPPSVALR